MKKLREIKIYVDGRSKEIQQKLFELDGAIIWAFNDRQNIKFTDAPFLLVNKYAKLTCHNSMTYFKEHPFTELKADEILSMEKEYEFKPFQQVLVRDKSERWIPDIFSDKIEDAYPYRDAYPYYCFRGNWKHCIPYEGNEHLNGTTGKP